MLRPVVTIALNEAEPDRTGQQCPFRQPTDQSIGGPGHGGAMLLFFGFIFLEIVKCVGRAYET